MNYKIGIIGLGYVGLPLAVEFSKHYDVVGFDINKNRINDLKKGIDKTEECSVNYESLKKSSSSIIYDVKSKLDRNLITDRL